MTELGDFDKLLKTADGRKQFMTFLKSEFSDENLEFWLMVESYKTMVSFNDRRTKKLAESIYTDYVRPDGNRSVNISSATQKNILLNIKDLSIDLFNDAQNEVYNLMKDDCFPRFINSKFADEFKKLHLETPGLERKKKKARPFDTVIDCDSPHKIQRKSTFLKPEDRYEDYMKKTSADKCVDEEIPPQVPKRRESLGCSLTLSKDKTNHPLPSSSVKALLASVSETNLDNDCYSMIANPSFYEASSAPSAFSTSKTLKILLPNQEIVSEIVSLNLKFFSVIQNLLEKYFECEIGDEFKLLECSTKNVVDVEKTVSEYSETSFFLVKNVMLKILFFNGISINIECSSQKYVPAAVSAILQKMNCSNISETLKFLVNKNSLKLSHTAEEYKNQVIILPETCQSNTLFNMDSFKTLHQEEEIRIKSIEFKNEFYEIKNKRTSFVVENQQGKYQVSDYLDSGPKDSSHIYSIPSKQRPVSMSFPIVSDSQNFHQHSAPFPVNTNLVKSMSLNVRNSVSNSVPNYANTTTGLLEKSKTTDKENNEDLNLCDDFFENIMKQTYVKLNTADLENNQQNNKRINQSGRISALPNRRESFHRAKLAIVQSSPARRSNSLPRQSSGSSPYSNITRKLPPFILQEQTLSTNVPEIPFKRTTMAKASTTPAKTPSLMKTLSKFHKIY